MSIRSGILALSSLFALAGCGSKALLNCPTPLAICGDQCIDIKTDALNCGACAHACNDGTTCVSGMCGGPCAHELTTCDFACVDLRSDHAHCGDCKVACKGDEVCSAGKCAVSCAEGLTGCNGACLDLSKDVANCGACAHACAQGHSCVGGACLASCAPPLIACGDKCVDSRFDPDHCGACDKVCPGGANIVRYCMSGACGNLGCEHGFYDCNFQIGDGCEVDGRTDLMNCGGCYQGCFDGPNSTTACQDAMCTVATCDKGFGDCNKMQFDGCESQLDSDVNNCTACGKPCPQPAHVVAACTAGKCSLGGCEDGFVDCNNDMKDGCEAQLARDPQNCGKCGNVCPMDLPFCGNGMCNPTPTLVGQYNVEDGPDWFGDPPTYNCLEGCAIVFGGTAADYSCSIDPNMITNTAWVSGYADGQHCDGNPVAEDFKMNNHYNCGNFGCAYSAYVRDNCFGSTNYCWQ